MLKHNQDGAINGLAISLILVVLLLIGAIVFGGWAYSSRQDYKNNVDGKINTAVDAAKKQEGTVKDAQFAQDEKQPLRTYTGPGAYGSLVIDYPKTWSGYVDASGTGTALLDGYFYPGIVPSITAQTSAFALRVQVLNQAYAQALQIYSNPPPQGQSRTVTAYALPKVPNSVGVKISGALSNNKTGALIILPLRSQTLEIWTDGNTFLDDFNANILPNFTFSP